MPHVKKLALSGRFSVQPGLKAQNVDNDHGTPIAKVNWLLFKRLLTQNKDDLLQMINWLCNISKHSTETEAKCEIKMCLAKRKKCLKFA